VSLCIKSHIECALKVCITNCIGGYEGASSEVASQDIATAQDDLLQPGSGGAGD
jgi:hypothetical protein